MARCPPASARALPWLNVDYVARYVDADAQIDGFDFMTGVPFDTPGSNLSENFYQRIQLQSAAMDGLIEQTLGFNSVDVDHKDARPFASCPNPRANSRTDLPGQSAAAREQHAQCRLQPL